MALIWGGFIYIFITLALSVFISFILGQVDKNRLYIYTIWLLSSSMIMFLFSKRYSIAGILASATTGIAFVVLAILITHLIIFNTNVKKYFERKRILCFKLVYF